VPAQYATVSSRILMAPSHVVREVIPAQYATGARAELVSYPQAIWSDGGY
jgi:hypothetical protein